jgi:tetratricopeptide (TPR) repeat protein
MTQIDDIEFVLAAWDAGEYKDIVERGSALIVRGADISSIVMLYADALMELGRTSEAREAYKLALTVLPNRRHARVLGALGALEVDAGDVVAAEQYCLRAMALAPDHASAYIWLGAAYEDADRLADAEAQYSRATKCGEGAIEEAWYNLGAIQKVLGRTSEAVISFRRALAIDRDYALAQEALATLEKNQHRAIEA